eukprot:TRINITY_DN37356_c0_g1_i1.p1 TRINITY_DN37356_c0_g1~~TRINITY_DN37356_c0_g1_i1.p1  ORF type:complete len:233 (-),score=40.66 TRINITY_DN37356_c0_g1_i1:415-1113(-)
MRYTSRVSSIFFVWLKTTQSRAIVPVVLSAMVLAVAGERSLVATPRTRHGERGGSGSGDVAAFGGRDARGTSDVSRGLSKPNSRPATARSFGGQVAERLVLDSSLARPDGQQQAGSSTVQDCEFPVRAPQPPAAHEQNARSVDALRMSMTKDRVAFLMMRAPNSSAPSPRLKQMESDNVLSKKVAQSTTRSYFVPSNHVVSTPRELRFEKRRDRVTEYMEIRLMQSDIGFRK